ncbi:SsgA family sporulation/cell division regulator [Nonomuraea sp. NPDC050790]|uniref:SsgA family sporulation/cell division regulator n=1 Tax=Nonomuraea sp. NPDC050790 TaxID=3364371 RepID=UPI0037AD89EC
MRTHVIHRPLTLWADHEHGQPPRCATLVYSVSDPYAVKLILPARCGDATSVLFSRILLVAGLGQPTGEGAVRIQPHELDDYITLTLPSDGALREFHACRDVLETFADTTYRMVPLGREQEFVDWDAVAARLLEVTP